MTNNIEKLAAKDAEELMAAHMFYGEGAGTRRKLVEADIDGKVMTMPGYEEALTAAYSSLNPTVFAERAIKERKRIDFGRKAAKNVKALRTGNHTGLSTGLMIVVGGYYLAKQTGTDKVITQHTVDLTKRVKERIQHERTSRKARKLRENVYRIDGDEDERPAPGYRS